MKPWSRRRAGVRFTDPSGPTLRCPALVRLEDPSTGDDERDRPELLPAELNESSFTAPWCTSRRCTTAAFPPGVGSFAAAHRAFSSATAFPSSSERVGAPGVAEALRKGRALLAPGFPLGRGTLANRARRGRHGLAGVQETAHVKVLAYSPHSTRSSVRKTRTHNLCLPPGICSQVNTQASARFHRVREQTSHPKRGTHKRALFSRDREPNAGRRVTVK